MKTVSSLISIMYLLCGCTQENSTAPSDTQHSDNSHEVEWGYEGAGSPQHWADLNSEFSVCRQGTEQSPIDLAGATLADESAIERRLGQTVLTGVQRATVMDIVDNGHTIQITNDVPMSLEVDGDLFELVQYHFHAPSEHTIDGEHSPLEVHFVHKSSGGSLSVIGVLVDEGEYDPIWETILAQLPDGPGDARHIENPDLDMNQIRPLPRRYYRYEGSLTTPPCSEGVNWFVMADQRQISKEQMATITAHLHNNNRPVQPLGTRTLRLISGDEQN